MNDRNPRGGGSGRRPVIAGIAAFIPVIPIVIALLVSTGGPSAATKSAPFTPLAPAAPRQQNRVLAPVTGALVALVERSTEMRSAPGGPVFAQLPTRNEFGSPQVFWVVRRTGRWLGVIAPQAGNGNLGWIAASAASLRRVDWELKVSLSHRQLSVLEGARVLERYTVAVGQPSAPTPLGRFAVTDRLSTGNPSGPYGCCILALSAKAPHAIQNWSGGDRIAIHSTPETSTIGRPVSHGCLRLTLAQGRWLLNHIPLGTPTLIGS